MGSDWIEVELEKVCEINMGQSPPSSTYNEKGNGLPFFQGKAEFTKLHPKVVKWCTEPKKIAEKGDILISVRAPVGATNLADQKCAIGRGLAAITYPFGNGYLWYYLQLIEKKLDSLGTGTTFKAISGQILRSQKFPLAPLPEQRAIVARIEELFSELDHAISNLQAARAKLEIYRQAVLKKAFEGGFNSNSDKSREIPSEWNWVKFKELILNSPQNGLYLPASEYGSGTKIIRIDGFYDGVLLIDYDFKRVRINQLIIDKYLVEEGDILINRVNSMSHLGKCGLVKKLDEPTVFESNIMRIKLKLGIALPNYIVHYLTSRLGISELVKNAKQAVNQASINQTDVSNTIIPLAPFEEQTQIVQEIESRLSVADKLAETIQINLQKSEALRQSILKKAFDGRLLSEAEVEACRKETDWEPAELLLAHIKKGYK